MLGVTDLDHRLISLLRQDGRLPVSVLAERLQVSRATVTKRLDRLRANGVIVGFTVQVKDTAGMSGARAISFIEVEGHTTDQVVARLRGFPEIQGLHTTNGGWDLVAEISCPGLVEFDDVLRRIRGIPGVVNSETSLLLSSVVR